MTGKEALEQLLAHSPLTFTQNADGTIVVSPKVRKAHRASANKPPVAAAQPPVESPAAPPAPAPVQSALEREGPWIVRARAVYVDPQNLSPAFAIPGVPDPVPVDGARSNQRFEGEIDGEYFFSSHWSTELAVGIPHAHELSLSGAGGNIGNYRLSPNFLTVKYGFLPESALRPYLGVGVNVLGFYDQNLGPYRLSKVTAGPAAQGGFDIRLSDHWSLNADVKWAYARPNVELQDESLARLKFDPVFVGVGIGYRFGGSAPAPTPKPAAQPAPVSEAPPEDSDGDGVPDSIDQCPNTPPGVKVDGRGCPLDSDHDGVPDYLDQCPGTPPGLKVDANGCEIEELVLKGVNFETASATLTAESSSVLDQVIEVLRQRPKARAAIHGYTDNRGSDVFNQRLSERRAKAVADYFVAHGISADELSSKGFGKASPVAPNDTPDGRAQNRRVTIEFSRPVPRS